MVDSGGAGGSDMLGAMDAPDPPSTDSRFEAPELPGAAGRPSPPASRGHALDGHFTLLGALHIAFSSMALLAAFVGVSLFWGGAMMAHDEEAGPVLALLGCGVLMLLVLISLPGIIGGIGLLRRRRWSRIVLMVVGGLHLINVPLGTLLGIYTLWVLLQPEAEAALVNAGS